MNQFWAGSGVQAVATHLAVRWPSAVLILVLFGTLRALHPLLTRRQLPKNAPRLVPGLPLLGAVRFFTARLSFVTEARSRPAASRNFSFFLGRFPVVSLGGPDGRCTIFEAKDSELNLSDGYSLLLNGRPPLKRPTEKHIQSIGVLGARVKTNQLSHHLPDLVSETQARIKDIVESCGDKARGGHGIFNPYDEVLRVAYTLLLCQFGAKEMLRDQAVLERSKGWVQTLMASQSVTQIIFPWLGKFLSFRRTLAGIQLFRLIGNLQKARERNNIREDDWLQHLMDEGHNTLTILTYVLAALFAGTANTTITACYVPAYVITNKTWYSRVQEEIDDVIARHRKTASQTITEVLATLPLSSWENEFPALQLCLHETLRFTVLNPVYRKNTSGKSIPIGKSGEVIPPESYVVLTLDEAHSDDRLYQNPSKWDPSRFEGESPEGQDQYSYIGWGAGRHTCVGIRFAKLLEVIVIAHLLAVFKLEAVDEQGNLMTRQPGLDEKGASQEGWIEKIRFRYEVRERSI